MSHLRTLGRFRKRDFVPISSWLCLRESFWFRSFFFGFQAWGGAAVTYHGRILDSNDRAVEATHVRFKIQVRSPGTESCLLYEEERTVNMAGSEGIFVIPIGDGNGARSSNDPGITVENVFSNNAALHHASLSCNSGTTYDPSPLDSRRLLVSFDDQTGSGIQVLPAMDVNYVPFALHAVETQNTLSVGGTPASRMMSVSSGAAAPLSAANFAELLSIVNGTSNAYLKSSALPSCGSGEFLKAVAGVITCVAESGGTVTESDPTVQSYAKTAPGAGLKVTAGAVVADFGAAPDLVNQNYDYDYTTDTTSAAGGNETRPANVNVLYCVKY